MLVGQISRFILVESSGPVDLIGIRFQPGGLYSLLGLTAYEISDRWIDLSSADPRLERRLREVNAPDTDCHRVNLQSVLLAELTKHDSGPSIGERAIGHLTMAHGKIRIDELARRIGVTVRQLERRFLMEIGLTPKRYARIVRFARVVNLVQSIHSRNWHQLALSSGYFDQAHLIRDFRHFAGQTPSEYFNDRHVMADYFSSGSSMSHLSNTVGI